MILFSAIYFCQIDKNRTANIAHFLKISIYIQIVIRLASIHRSLKQSYMIKASPKKNNEIKG